MRVRAGKPEPAIGVIGGSGLYEMEGLEEIRWIKMKTPFGDPSDAYCTGRFQGRRMIFLPRHGRGHRLTPSELNYRANIYGMKALGAHALVSISAVGSMKEEIHPLELVVPDQFYDNTRRRAGSFFGDGIVAHVGMAHPVCAGVAAVLAKAGKDVGARVHRGGTYICIEGPQFSTKGESEIYRRCSGPKPRPPRLHCGWPRRKSAPRSSASPRSGRRLIWRSPGARAAMSTAGVNSASSARRS